MTERLNALEARIARAIGSEKLPVDERLVAIVADWGTLMHQHRERRHSRDLYQKFAIWAVQGRIQEFIDFARSLNNVKARRALSGIRRVCTFAWPMSGAGGLAPAMFAGMWGWLQLGVIEYLRGSLITGPKDLRKDTEQLRELCRAHGTFRIRY